MSRSYMYKACCQWPHDRYPGLACPKRVVHGCMSLPNLFYMLSSYRAKICMIVYDRSPKSCLHLQGLKCPEMYYKGIFPTHSDMQ